MNNPLVPQGSLLEQKNKSRVRVKIAVFLVLAIHGIALLALLMQGCKKEPDVSTRTEATNNPATTFVEPNNAPPGATNDLLANSNTATPPVDLHPQTSAPITAATEYVIAKGDNFSAIAKKLHVSLKALIDANPGVEPTKLKIGQKINVPPPPAPVTSATVPGTTSSISGETNGEQLYSVKSGDSLSKIATQFGTTVKALRSLNNLKTDKIVVGQKLKIPPKASGTAAPSETAAPANPTNAAAGQ